jgi:hypothetical protein
LGERRTRFFDDVLGPALAEAETIGIGEDEILAFMANRSGRQEK